MISVALSSCRHDYSTLDTAKIQGVVFDTIGNSSLSVYQFEHLVVKPVLSMGNLQESDLSFKWSINLLPGDTLFQVLSETRDLDAEIRLKPNTTGKYHHLLYTVTDKRNGLKYIMAWPLTVKNNIGEGLVVAETGDNLNTDLSHIMSPEVTTGYTSVSVKHRVYSSINKGTIPGLVKQMQYTTIYGVNALLAITNDAITRINTLDYTYGGVNNDLFFGASASYKPQALSSAYQSDIYIGSGKLTSVYFGANRKFGLPFDFNYTVPDKVAVNGNSSSVTGSYQTPVAVNFYDEVNGYFVYLPALGSFGDNKMHAYPPVAGKSFNPANVPGKTNLAAGISVDRGFLHLLKDKTTGKIELYVFGPGVDNYPDIIPADPRALYDLSAAPGISSATQFVFLDDQKVMYYVSGNKIYAVLYSTATPVVEERYTPPAGEQITTLQIYQQCGYPLAQTYIATNNKQLIMSTYGTEGKVYLLPIKNLGLGTIDAANGKSFGGFGRITAIAPQK
jgi:hypothetical protein